jgi:hypothetical protein
MGYFLAVLAGYVLGAKAGSKDLDDVVRSLKAVRDTEEFGDLVSALRSHAGHTLRGLADMIDGDTPMPAIETGDLVDRVRHIFGRN